MELNQVRLSGTTYDIQDSGATQSLGGLKLVKLTQAQYDALSGNVDASTVYYIVN